ncbi:class I SAM-dependent methyltransferase [Ottowia sp.]|uniref:class I SAM-dependent methyltransferase n=1 Tax=Ottowia sp. TaxID=1898956 RepID=UPI0025E1FE5A|nr:class I SAM-dependent methyltransferase [Ottowia sp.]MBK6616350.1 class I SAM-dependent methyltransferase [Ottowia sp.]
MKQIDAQADLFGDSAQGASDVALMERPPAAPQFAVTSDPPAAQPVARRTVIQAPKPAVASSPPAQAKDERYEGWTNSATYLADLYIAQSASAVTKVRALIDDAGIIDERKLSRLFTIRVAREQDAEADDYLSGIDGDTIILDYWARGQINWKEIAYHTNEDERRELGLKTVDEAVLHALGTATVSENVIRLNTGQLPRDVYAKVDRVLRLMGGKWTKKLGGHLFDDDPSDAFDTLLLTGQVEKPDNFGAFFTPAGLADHVISLANLKPGMTFAEPSAGGGALLSRAAAIVGIENCVAVELQPALADNLRAQGYTVFTGDFMSRGNWHPAGNVDRIVMNPPFSRQLDVEHVLHGYSMLSPGGRLVSIMSASVSFRTNHKTVAFRELVSSVGYMKDNPQGSFKESGTNVNTVVVVLDKPA